MTTAKPKKNKSKIVAARPIRLWHDQHKIQEDVQVNIVPLIDVIFCILTFFILGAVGLTRQQAIGLDLPKASTSTTPMREMLVVSIDDFGQLYVEKQTVTRDQLMEAIRNYHKSNPRGLMVVNASRNANYNEVVGVIDMLRQVGGDRVALATTPGESELPGDTNTLPNSWSNPATTPTIPTLPALPAPDNSGRSTTP